MKNTSVRISEKTQEKLNFVRNKMITENVLNGDNGMISWDAVYERIADYYLGSVTPILESKAKHFETEQKIFQEFRNEIFQEFEEIKQQNEFIKRQNDAASIELKSIQNFSVSMNENLRNVLDVVRGLFSNIGDSYQSAIKTIDIKIKRYLGMLMPNILSILSKIDNTITSKLTMQEREIAIPEIKEKTTKIIKYALNIYKKFDKIEDSNVIEQHEQFIFDSK